MSDSGKAVFLSYASQDAEAAKRIADALRAAGVEVWFDQEQLVGGDAWDRKIRKQIGACALFVPIISADTQARAEGYFRLEWRLADQRTHLMGKAKAFLLPVCLDDTPDSDADVPDSFLAVQWSRLRPAGYGGQGPWGGDDPVLARFVERVKQLLDGGPSSREAVLRRDSAAAGSRPPGTAPAGGPGGAPPAIPDFELLRVIGRGAYGEVWLARGITGIYRAIKVVWRAQFETAEPFEREFRGLKEFAAISLKLEGQMALLHIGRNDAAGFFYYVMELADDARPGRTFEATTYVPLTLRESLKQRGRLPAAEAIAVGRQLAAALAGLHQRGLVHRDIKLANVILVNGRAKLADIGLVSPAAQALTFIGTSGYVPPEGPGSPAADVYALGRVLYELATGHSHEEFPRLPAEINDPADRGALFALNEVLLHAGEPTPEKRYRDAGEMLADLEALEGGGAPRGAGRNSWGRAGVALGLVALAGGVAWWQLKRPVAASRSAPASAAEAPAAEAPARSIAVLPFANLSDDKENGYFADGMSEDILTDLANLSALRVVARTTMLQYRQTTKPIRQIGRELNVAFVLEGSVRRAGNKVRVSGQLIRAATEAPVWAKTYDRDLTDVFAIQSELSRDIVTALSGVLTAQDETMLAARPTTSIAAYDLYREARALDESEGTSRETTQKKLALLERAVQLDPNYVEAVVKLAMARLEIGSEIFDKGDPAQVARCRAELDRAERLAPNNYTVLITRSSFAAFQGDRAEVNRYRQRIAELFPGRAEAWFAAALTAGYERRYEDQVADLRRALATDPRNLDILSALGDGLKSLRRYDESADALRQMLAVQPGARHLEYELAIIPLHQRGSTAELREFLAKLETPADLTNPNLIALRAQGYMALGDVAAFLRLWREAGPNWRFNEGRVLDDIMVAVALQAAGDSTDLRPQLEAARDRSRAITQREPGNIRRWNLLGLCQALLGEKPEARATLAHVRELLREFDATGAPGRSTDIWFYNGLWRGWAGEVEEGIAQMAGPLRGPVPAHPAFVHEMRRSFLMLPFRGHPAFNALLDDPVNNAPLYGNNVTISLPAAPTSLATTPSSSAKPSAVAQLGAARTDTESGKASLPDSNSIAVLPFANQSDDKENGYLADGIHEDIVTSLAGVRGLKVTSYESAVRYRRTDKAARVIGQELGVAYLLSGSLRREGKQIRVTARLVDTRTDQQVWAKSFDREITAVLALQSDLAAAIVPSLSVVLNPTEAAAIAQSPTSSNSAYDLFLRARKLRSDGYTDGKDLAEAERLLRRAVEEDPRFGRAWVELANLQVDWVMRDISGFPAARIAAAEEALARARRVIPDAPEVSLAAGRIRHHCYQDFAGALTLYRSVLESHPNYFDVTIPLAQLYRRLGRWGEVLALLRDARRAEPGNRGVLILMNTTLLWTRRYAELEARLAAEEPALFQAQGHNKMKAQVGLIRQRTRAPVDEWLAGLSPAERESEPIVQERFRFAALAGDLPGVMELLERYGATWERLDALQVPLHLGKREMALKLLAKLEPDLARRKAELPHEALTWADAAGFHAIRGEREAALAAMAKARELLPEERNAVDGPDMSLQLAVLLAWLGEKDAAIAECARLIKLPLADFSLQVPAAVGWLPLRGDPRFEAILNDPANRMPLVDDHNRMVVPAATPVTFTVPGSASAGATAAAPTGAPVFNLGTAPVPATPEKSVAVLAFANLSEDKANEYFSDGISEELLNVLAKVPALKVAARTSAFHFKGRNVPVAEIAQQLGVAYVVEGSVRKQGDKVRITAQLIKAADGFQVWSDTFTRDLKDIFAVQEEIAARIAGNLSLKLGMSSSAASHPVDPEAYRLMTWGRDLVYRAGQDDLRQAQQYLEEAIERDPGFAAAWAWLSIARWARAAGGGLPIDAGFQSARVAGEKAVSLQPDLPEAHTAAGLVYYGYDWDWAKARAAFERAATLAPGDAATTSHRSRLAITLGHNEEALATARRSVALDPLNSYAQYVLGMALLQTGGYAELEVQSKPFLRVSRAATKAHVFALLLLGKNEEALRVAKDWGQERNRYFVLSLAHWACGQRAEADAALERLIAESSDLAAYQIAELYAQRGDVDRAFAWLETSIRQRDTGMIWVKNDPWLRNLHADPRWPSILKKMNLWDGDR